jgi:hypothetical protein
MIFFRFAYKYQGLVQYKLELPVDYPYNWFLRGSKLSCALDTYLSIHRKKAFRYSRPQPGSHLPNSPWAGIMTSYINYSCPGEFGKWHPGWGREYRKAFFTVYVVSMFCELSCFSRALLFERWQWRQRINYSSSPLIMTLVSRIFGSTIAILLVNQLTSSLVTVTKENSFYLFTSD